MKNERPKCVDAAAKITAKSQELNQLQKQAWKTMNEGSSLSLEELPYLALQPS